MARIKSDPADTAYEYIKKQIADFELRPGAVVSSSMVAKELNMSRTPVNEAILSLVQVGIIHKERTKFTVAPITLDSIRDATEIRELRELFCVRKIMTNGGLSESQYLELYEIYKQSIESIQNKNFKDNFRLDSMFHEKIIEFAQSQMVSYFANQYLKIQTERLRWISLLRLDRYEVSMNEHLQILESMKSGNIERTQKAVNDHYRKSLENYISIITTNEQWVDIVYNLRLIASNQ